VKQRKHSVEINADEIMITLSALDPEVSDREMEDGLDWPPAIEILSKLIELYNDRDSNSNRHLSIERLISGLAVRRKVCKQVHEGHLDENVFLALDEMAIGH